jgi:flagellar protein FlaG
MNSQDVKQVASATGTFPAVQTKADRIAPAGKDAEAGKVAPESGNQPPEDAKEQPDLQALAAKLNVASQSIGRDLRFKVDMDSGRSVIQVLDRDTGEIIREIPPEKAQFSVAGNGDMQIRLYDALA